MAPIDQKVNIEFVEDVESSTGGKSGAKDGDLLVDASGDILRLPIPSADPNDPLNFTNWEKTGVILSCCWFCELASLWDTRNIFVFFAVTC